MRSCNNGNDGRREEPLLHVTEYRHHLGMHASLSVGPGHDAPSLTPSAEATQQARQACVWMARGAGAGECGRRQEHDASGTKRR
jgi:hypothetical protein